MVDISIKYMNLNFFSKKTDTLKKKIGIPRSFFYYFYPGLWETYFSEIGFIPVLSKPSNLNTANRASIISEAEHCFPIKLFDAHAEELLDSVDILFVPRIISMKKDYIACPKFGALPDAATADVASDKPLLIIEINENKKPLKKTLLELGCDLKVPSLKVKNAIEKAYNRMYLERELLMKTKYKEDAPTFLILGHPYILHDPFISGMIIKKLNELKVNIEIFSFSKEYSSETNIMWCTSNKMYHKISTMEKSQYNGIIQIAAFNCGCDSMMIETFRPVINEKKIPYMVLIIDEHSAQAGLDTRLEAFIDSTGW